MSKTRSDAEYEELARMAENGEFTAAGPAEPGSGAGVVMKAGRPAGRKSALGDTPSMSVRLPAELRGKIDALAVVDEVKPSEVVRVAVAEYTARRSDEVSLVNGKWTGKTRQRRKRAPRKSAF